MDLDEVTIGAAVLAGPDAVLAADRGGTVRFWNPGAERIFGFAAAEAIGASLDIIIPERLRPRHWEGWHRVAQTGQSRYGSGDLLSVPARHADGRTLSVEFSIHMIFGADHEVQGFAATLRDVTDRYQELRELRRRVANI